MLSKFSKKSAQKSSIFSIKANFERSLLFNTHSAGNRGSLFSEGSAFDSLNPVVCFDESSKQQIQEVIDALPMEPGKIVRYDSEYERNGVSNLFMIFEPLRGRRWAKVTDRRTKIDWAKCIRFKNSDE